MVGFLEGMLVTVVVCGSLLALMGLYVALYWLEDSDEAKPAGEAPAEQPAPEAVNSTQNNRDPL